MSRMTAVIRITRDAPKEQHETSDGESHTGPGGLYKAARHLISTGSSVGRKVIVMRGDKICLTSTVGHLAELAWGGSEKDPYQRRWRPMPGEPMPERLAAWWHAVEQARATGR